MVFGSKRETKPDSLSREDVVGNLYPDSLTSEVDVAQPSSEFPRGGDRGNESVIDPHARFNGKYEEITSTISLARATSSRMSSV